MIPHARTHLDRPYVRRLPAGVLPVAQAAVPRLSEQITARIRDEVDAFAGERRRRLRHLIYEAVTVAVDAFVRLAAGDHAAYARVEEHFHALGHIEAVAGMGIAPVVEAIRLADGSVWQTIRTVAAHKELGGVMVADLGADVSAYLKYLEARVELGFAIGSTGGLDPGDRLLAALLRGRSGDELVRLADDAGWQLSEQAVVLTSQRFGASPAGMVLPARTLARTDGDRTIVVTGIDDLVASRRALLGLGPSVIVVESGPVELRQAGDAYVWTRRALALVNRGLLRPQGRIVDCARHRMALLLAADPALVDSMASELLAPLFAEERRHQRLVLAETLLLRLETDEPAAAIARRLGNCAQTVRNRIHRLESMFGDRLADPNQRTMLILALNAVLPQWRTVRPRR